MAIRALDLFCGGGGSSYGARRAGAEIVCGVDSWPVAVSTYAANFPGAKSVHLDLREDTAPEALGDLGDIDLLLASPECTNHTCARGSRPRDEESKKTAFFVLNFAARLQPRWIVLENVVHMRAWRGYLPLLRALTAMGYNQRIEILDAARYGVPQTRRRLFVLCDRLAIPASIPAKRGRPPAAARIIDRHGRWPSRPLYRAGRADATIDRAKRAIAALGKFVPFLIVYYGTDGAGGWQSLDRPLRTITTLDRFGLVTWQGRQPMLRMLQPPELTKAMGFMDDYSLECVLRRRDRIKLLGNAVAPPVMEAVVRTLIGSGTSSRQRVAEATPQRSTAPMELV